MKRISEIVEKLHQNQLLHTCNVVLENKAKISTLTINTNIFSIIQPLITRLNLVYKLYEINPDFSLVVISKNKEDIEIMEEINDLSMTKLLRDTIYKSLLGTI